MLIIATSPLTAVVLTVSCLLLLVADARPIITATQNIVGTTTSAPAKAEDPFGVDLLPTFSSSSYYSSALSPAVNMDDIYDYYGGGMSGDAE